MKSKPEKKPAKKSATKPAPDHLRENLKFLKETESRLRRANVASAAYEAEALLRHYGKMDRLDLFAGKKPLSEAARQGVMKALVHRMKGTPLHYIVGEAYFLGNRLFVSKDVLLPRPETELLAEEALRLLEGKELPWVLDIGTGSGCIAVSLTIARPDCRMTALDISQKALQVARKNSNFHGLSKKIRFLQSDLFSRLDPSRDGFDLITANPPYIPSAEIKTLSREVRSEPRVALDGGADGLGVSGRILREAQAFLEPGGYLLMEIGKGQEREIQRLAGSLGYKEARFVKDYAGIDRILVVRKEK